MCAFKIKKDRIYVVFWKYLVKYWKQYPTLMKIYENISKETEVIENCYTSSKINILITLNSFAENYFTLDVKEDDSIKSLYGRMEITETIANASIIGIDLSKGRELCIIIDLVDI